MHGRTLILFFKEMYLAFDLLKKMLLPYPDERILVEDALKHKFI